MIRFVYFDVGGVVIDDFSGNNKWEQLKNELKIDSSNSDEFEEIWKKLEEEVVIGKDVESLLPILKEKFSNNIPEGYSLLNNGFVDRFQPNKNIWSIITELKKKVPVGLLTNMYPGMFDAIKKRNILPPIEWNVILDSSIEMLKKPDARLFKLAEERAGLHGSEILFIDNTIGHIEEANKFGWNAYYYDSSNHKKSVKKLKKEIKSYHLT